MALGRSDVADAAAAMLFVAPTNEARGPVASGVKIDKPFGGEHWSVLRGAEQCLGKRIVVADARAQVGRLDAKPIEHGSGRWHNLNREFPTKANSWAKCPRPNGEASHPGHNRFFLASIS
jgi:hypothetical protein